MRLWLVLIVVVQRSRRGNEIGEKGGKGVAVKAGRDRICSQLSCTGGRGGDDHKAMAGRMWENYTFRSISRALFFFE
jgi:hypothetical protein